MVDFYNHTAISAPTQKTICFHVLTAFDQLFAKKKAFDVGAPHGRVATIWGFNWLSLQDARAHWPLARRTIKRARRCEGKQDKDETLTGISRRWR